MLSRRRRGAQILPCQGHTRHLPGRVRGEARDRQQEPRHTQRREAAAAATVLQYLKHEWYVKLPPYSSRDSTSFDLQATTMWTTMCRRHLLSWAAGRCEGSHRPRPPTASHRHMCRHKYISVSSKEGAERRRTRRNSNNNNNRIVLTTQSIYRYIYIYIYLTDLAQVIYN